MTDEDKTPEKVVEVNTPEAQSINFPTQAAAYEWLMWRCPTEFHFAVGLHPTSGDKVVQITLPV